MSSIPPFVTDSIIGPMLTVIDIIHSYATDTEDGTDTCFNTDSTLHGVAYPYPYR